jgi:ribosomal protein S18 acetylase RimI-like enzyme
MKLRRLSPEKDLDELLRLGGVVFRAQPTDAMRELWRWKYQPPWVAEPLAWVGVVDGKIVMHWGAVRLLGRVDGEEAPFFQMTDIMVHPDHRAGYGFLTLPQKTAVQEIADEFPSSVIYGFTGRRTSIWYRRLGGILKEQACDRLVPLRELPAGSEGGSLQIREWEWTTDEVDRIWERIGPPTGLIRDLTWLRWRYAEHPTHDYQLLGVIEEGKAVGWLVTHAWATRETEIKEEVRILDLLLPQGLQAHALRMAARFLNAKMVVLWLPASRFEGESRDTEWVVLCRSLNPAVSSELVGEQLYYTLGEVDQWWW